MGFIVLMVVALVASFAIPIVFGFGAGAMIASHLCILTVTLAMFFGVIRMKIGPDQK